MKNLRMPWLDRCGHRWVLDGAILGPVVISSLLSSYIV